MSKDIEIMDMSIGIRLRHKRTQVEFELGDYANEYSRYLYNQKYIGRADYINRSIQDDYEVIESE